MNFAELLERQTNQAYTENGALSNASTLNAIVDLYAIGGACRNMSDEDVYKMVLGAYAVDKELTLRLIFWLGDVRGGMGERRLFRLALTTIALIDPEVAQKVVGLIPHYTRWDNLYALVGTPLEDMVRQVIRTEHFACEKTGKPSLMYKWLKSTNTSSKESCKLGRWTANALGFGSDYKGLHAYQKLLSRKRAELNEGVVEVLMSAQEWDTIDYSKVPSKASLSYNKAFGRHDPIGFGQYLQDVVDGKAKINASVTFPHEIVHKYINELFGYKFNPKEDVFLENAWVALPQIIAEEENVLFVPDMSGSMSSPIGTKTDVSAHTVACGLSIYSAEKLRGVFKNKVITFSSVARFVDLGKFGDKLNQKIRAYFDQSIVDNTNLQSVFDLILDTAVKHKVPQADLPTKLVIISDMEFDYASDEETNLEVARAKFKAKGYELPQIVYWNVCARNKQFPALMDDSGIAMVSGYSANLLPQVLGNIETPLDTMLKTLANERYDLISKALGLA